MKTRDDCLTVIEGVVAVVIAKIVRESVGTVVATASLGTYERNGNKNATNLKFDWSNEEK